MTILLQKRTNGMRAFVPLALMIVPGAAYAQPLDQIEPGTAATLPAPWIAEAATAPLHVDATVPLALFDISAPTTEVEAALADAALPAIALTDAADADLQPIAISTALTDLGLTGLVLPDAILADATVSAAPDTNVLPSDAADAAEAANMAMPPVALAEQADTLFATAPVSENELAETKGREAVDWLAGIANNNSNVNNNHVGDNSVTGSVTVANSAFQNVTGISMVNFNTGNNSSINAAMNVNLQINYGSPTP